MEQRTVTIPPELAGKRIDVALANILPDFSRTQIKSWIDQGLVKIADFPIKPKMKCAGGETVAIMIPDRTPINWQAQAIPLTVVYEDEDILLINKPNEMVVHPGAGNRENTLLNALLHHAPQLNDIPRAGIIHRLDKNTTGLLIIAKNAGALKNLSQQLKRREISREYQAIVYGKMISGGKIDAPIGRNAIERKRMAVTETGKNAITHYRIIKKYPSFTHLSVQLETGRTHQIRVHLAHIHHPIVGDHAYGGRVRLSKGMNEKLITTLRQFKRQALHAFALQFKHPKTGELMRFEIPLPEDMQQFIEALNT